MSDERNGIVISLQNYKGGVGKTTIAINMVYLLSLAGYKVLIADLDDQSSSTEFFKTYRNGNQVPLSYINQMDYLSLFTSSVNIKNYIFESRFENIDILPRVRKSTDLISLSLTTEIDNVNMPNEEKWMKLAYNLDQVRGDYDYIIIDGGPSITTVTYCTLCASDLVIIPVEANRYSRSPIKEMLNVINGLNKLIIPSSTHPEIEILGIVCTKYDKKGGKSSPEIFKEFLEEYAGLMIERPIRYSNSLTNANNYGATVFDLGNGTNNGRRDLLNLVIRELDIIDEEHEKILNENGVEKWLYDYDAYVEYLEEKGKLDRNHMPAPFYD